MRTKLTKTTLCLIILGGFTAFIAFSGLFLSGTRATVDDTQLITLTQKKLYTIPNRYRFGYGNMEHLDRGKTTTQILHFSFNVGDKIYRGWGLPNEFNGKTTKIRYFSKIPQINISSSKPWFLLSFFFFFLAFGCRVIVMWGRGILHKKWLKANKMD